MQSSEILKEQVLHIRNIIVKVTVNDDLDEVFRTVLLPHFPCNMADKPQCDHVRLVSADGFEFIVDRKAASVSGTINNMINSEGE